MSDACRDIQKAVDETRQEIHRLKDLLGQTHADDKRKQLKREIKELRRKQFDYLHRLG